MMTTKYQVTPCVRVLILSITLLTLIALVVAVGSVGIIRLNHRVDHMAEVDVPRFDYLVHVDRDLYRAQRSLGLAFFATDPAVRSDHIEEFQVEVDSTAARWELYLAVAEDSEHEVAQGADYGPYRAAWLASTGELVALLRMGAVPGDPAATELLETVGADFFNLRSVVHDLEEEVAEPHIADMITAIERTGAATVDSLLVLFAVGLVAGGVVSFTTFRAVRIQHRRSVRREAQQVIEARRTAFETELNQALEMAQTEEAAIGAVELVLAVELADRPTELLLADSSQAHLERTVSTHCESGGPECQVFDPSDCASIRRGTTLTFEHSATYSACPHMRDRDGEPFSAVCIPMSVAGRTVGVLHSTGADGEEAPPDDVYKLELVADRAGDRVGVLRAFAQSQTQAATDPLTGLLNRRSFETQASRHLRSGQNLAFAYGDLDHFKLLNDRHGHEAGDRALRLFSKVLGESARDGDLAARWGGEEFVLMINDADSASAVGLIERIRGNLVLALAGSNSAPFTASFGVSDTSMAGDLERLVSLADESLLEAKRRGRDLVMVAGSWESDTIGDTAGEVVAS